MNQREQKIKTREKKTTQGTINIFANMIKPAENSYLISNFRLCPVYVIYTIILCN